jgi:hypothetical protein
MKDFNLAKWLMNNNVFFLDMEFGAIYGSYRRDFIPLEIGGIISNFKTDSLSIVRFVHHEFPFDGDVVLRKNLIDDLGHTIGLSETVANTKRVVEMFTTVIYCQNLARSY